MVLCCWRNTIADAAFRASLLHLATRSLGSSPHPLPERLLTAAGSPLSSLLQPPWGSRPDEYDLSRALKTALTVWEYPDWGRRVVHGFVVKLGYSRFTILMTTLVDLTAKCGRDLCEARKLFDELTERDVVSWTSMIVGYARRGHYRESLEVFRRMVLADTVPNSYSYSGALNACSGLRALRHGRQVHAHLLKASANGGIDPVVQNNLECGMGEDALRLLARMVCCGLKPDRFTYATCVDACGYVASMRKGIQVHTGVVKAGFHSDLVVSSALVDMYARCGSVESAKLVFDALSTTDTILWTTMIGAYSKCGLVAEATSTFELMLALGIKPDEITFLAVLSACSHGGLAGKGWHYFRSMTEVHGVYAKLEHYSCMVDLLCRGGHLEDALRFIKQIPCKPSVATWTTFLNSCRLQGNIGLARAACQFLEMDVRNHGILVALSNAYAAVGCWDETWEIRRKMRDENVKKEAGCSWVEIEDGLHVFPTEG